MAKVILNLKTPEVPNFIIIEMPPGKRQDGFKESPKLKVGDLTDLQLEQIASDWGKALFSKARQQRDLVNDPFGEQR